MRQFCQAVACLGFDGFFLFGSCSCKHLFCTPLTPLPSNFVPCAALSHTQVKILRDQERPDAAGHPGGKSRGFGFVEFNDHTHALAGANDWGGGMNGGDRTSDIGDDRARGGGVH